MKTTSNPWGLPKPKRYEEVVTLSDPEQPEFSESVTLRALGIVDSSKIFRDIRGVLDLLNDHNGQRNHYPCPDGTGVDLTDELIHQICRMSRMEPEETRHDFGWWLGLAVRCRNAYTLALLKSVEIDSKQNADAEEEDPEERAKN